MMKDGTSKDVAYACNTESGCNDSKAELFDCGVANVTSKVTHTSMLVCMVLTISFCFASSVSFGSFRDGPLEK